MSTNKPQTALESNANQNWLFHGTKIGIATEFKDRGSRIKYAVMPKNTAHQSSVLKLLMNFFAIVYELTVSEPIAIAAFTIISASVETSTILGMFV